MAEIAGRPFLERLIEHLAAYGFQRFVLCTGHKADSVEAHFRTRQSPYEVAFSREHVPLGTAGGLRHARNLLPGDPILVLNGDSFCPVDYPALLGAHRSRGSAATLAVVAADDTAEYGQVLFSDDGTVTAFREKLHSSGAGWINAGVYVFRHATLAALPDRSPLSLEKDVFPALVGKGLHAWKTRGPLLDIGTPERYLRAQTELASLMRSSARIRLDAASDAPGSSR